MLTFSLFQFLSVLWKFENKFIEWNRVFLTLGFPIRCNQSHDVQHVSSSIGKLSFTDWPHGRTGETEGHTENKRHFQTIKPNKTVSECTTCRTSQTEKWSPRLQVALPEWEKDSLAHLKPAPPEALPWPCSSEGVNTQHTQHRHVVKPMRMIPH